MPVVLYSCPFVPPEWIEAHGLTPKRVAPSGSDASVRPLPGMCPYARAFAGFASTSDAAAVIVTTACDQMRRAADIITQSSQVPLFLMNVPHTWQSPSARELYIAELVRLSHFLITLGGSAPAPAHLREIMLRHETQRNQPAVLIGPISSHRSHRQHPIALLGGPVPPDSDIFDLIDRAGGHVALDGAETGERTTPAPFDQQQLADDPIAAIADAYFAIPDPFRRPNTAFYDWLKRALPERGIRAIVLRRYVWCDTWHAEAQRIKETTGLPLLEIEIADTPSDAERTLSRLQSLMETLA